MYTWRLNVRNLTVTQSGFGCFISWRAACVKTAYSLLVVSLLFKYPLRRGGGGTIV